jgi:hypothetical protein
MKRFPSEARTAPFAQVLSTEAAGPEAHPQPGAPEREEGGPRHQARLREGGDEVTTLGVDPGSSHVGWCLLRDGILADNGQWSVQEKRTWKARLNMHRRTFATLIAELKPDLLCIEQADPNASQGLLQRLAEHPEALPQIRAQLASTGRLTQLVQALAEVAHEAWVPVQYVHPATVSARLGLKRGATDRQASEAFNVRFGQRLLVREHHIARAAGCALAAKHGAATGSGAPRLEVEEP